ncbi:MAG: GTP-binding protein, partial [Pseudohongiella sp.]
MTDQRIPVTVLTGFLGSGKTTLLNRILTEKHGQRIAVIENEFGEVGIDQDLVINADEEIFEMNNGCICCTVRGDLIRILGNLARRRDKFDRIVLETTGMADPGPVAQTFFVDDDIKDEFCLDGIITLVDAGHIEQHIGSSTEVMAQIAFADLIVLNKSDLVNSTTLASLTGRLRDMNRMAQILPANMANVPLEKVLDVGGFNLDRALDTNPAFLEPEYPFEWGGIFRLKAGDYILAVDTGPDPDMSAIWIDAGQPQVELTELAEHVFRHFSHAAHPVGNADLITASDTHWKLQLASPIALTLQAPRDGCFALFTQHTPEELDIRLYDINDQLCEPVTAHYFNANHTHDDEVSSVAFEFEGTLDPEKFNTWLSFLLRTDGADLFRMKGILAITGDDRRTVFQGVHMV